MSKFTPDATSFDVNNIDQTASTDKVLYSFFNAYYQRFINNDAYLKAKVDRANNVVQKTLSASNWQGASAPYTYVINDISGVTADDSPEVFVIYPNNCTTAQKKAIDKATSYFTNIITGLGTITFYSTVVPTVDVTMGFKGV